MPDNEDAASTRRALLEETGLTLPAGSGRLGPIRWLELAWAALLLACTALVFSAPAGPLLWGGVALLTLGVGFLTSRTVRGLEQRLREARQLRNYRLVELLGRGGMGEVWRAEHNLLPRPAAIKLISPERLASEGATGKEECIRRFLAEARATVGLSSPHTIEIYDFGVTSEGMLCYVMEFLEGLDLETMVIESGPLPAARVVYLLRQVCISLAEAHQQNFVHRDIKPANIYSCRKGVHFDFVKVLDFGIAAETRAGSRRGAALKIVGTPTCVAPESILGRGFDARTDVYSLGCVAYWLLTGCTVFEAETPAEMISHHVHTRPVPPSYRVRRAIPRDLELVVLNCLKKHPDDRVSSAIELSKLLARCDVGPAWSPGQAMTWWEKRACESIRTAAHSPEWGAARTPLKTTILER